MVYSWGDHFGPRTALGHSFTFLTKAIMIISPVSNSSNHPLVDPEFKIQVTQGVQIILLWVLFAAIKVFKPEADRVTNTRRY